MNRLRIVSLIGQITHLTVAKDLAFQGKDEKAKVYLEDFLSIEKADIEKAFDFLISQCREVIWKLIEADQAFYRDEDKEITLRHLRNFALPTNTLNILNMCYYFIEVNKR